jgi:hypothetical protein
LRSATCPPTPAARATPIQLIRAVTLTWLFSGQRSDEIVRLRLGCIRWQHNNTPILGNSADVLARDAVCLLDIPTHKTGTAFTKPVDPLLGQAIETWQAIRPAQPQMLDRKTGEYVVAIIVQVELILLVQDAPDLRRDPGWRCRWSGVGVDRAPGGELGLVGCGPA